jgi:hypothetical protein
MVFHLFKCRYCNRQNLSAHFTSAVTSFPLKSYHRKPSGNSRYRRPGGTGIAFTVPRNAVVTLPPIDLLAVVNRSVLHSSFSAMNAADRFCRGSRSSRVNNDGYLRHGASFVEGWFPVRSYAGCLGFIVSFIRPLLHFRWF